MLHGTDMFAPAKSVDKIRGSAAVSKGGMRRVTINEAAEGESSGKGVRRVRAEPTSFA